MVLLGSSLMICKPPVYAGGYVSLHHKSVELGLNSAFQYHFERTDSFSYIGFGQQTYDYRTILGKVSYLISFRSSFLFICQVHHDAFSPVRSNVPLVHLVHVSKSIRK